MIIRKQIEWLGDERELPCYGIVFNGSKKILPLGIADSYIAQGLAKEITKPRNIKSKEVN